MKKKRKSKGSVSTQSAKPKRKKSRLILMFLLTTLVILFVLIFISFKAWDLLEKKKVQKIEIVDGCTYFMGSILHQIRDLPDCQNSCRSECYILDKNFVEVEFEGFEDGCNTCNCYCK